MDNTPKQIGLILEGLPIAREAKAAKEAKPRKSLEQRLSDTAVVMGDDPILYQHSVLCQTCLPYRDPGDEVRRWERGNGKAHILLTAGEAYRSAAGGFVEVGLPFGPKPRLALYHLNTEAIRTQSPVIELEDSLTAFVKRTLGLDPMGRNIRIVKDQLTRLASADFRFGASRDGHDVTVKGSIVDGFDLWSPKDPRQRIFWPTSVRFSAPYFSSVLEHAIPLNELAIMRLAHNAMALDIYTWLAQRLHRVPEERPACVPWTALQGQFGQGYTQIRDFRRVFVRTLRQVHVVYPEAKFELTAGGMILRHSRPPIDKRLLPMSRR